MLFEKSADSLNRLWDQLPVLPGIHPLGLRRQVRDLNTDVVRMRSVVARQNEQDPVILGKLECLEVGAVAGAELRPVLQEIRNVCPQRAREGA